MHSLALIIHNVRSAHNVGSLLRTADGLGVEKVYLSGYSPYPIMESDSRLPHIAAKAERQISKTALGAEKSLEWTHEDNVAKAISQLKHQGFTVAALEQTAGSKNLVGFVPPAKIAIVVGPERDGLDEETIRLCDLVLEIPMLGQKESFNVAVAGAIALYELRHRHP